MTAYEPSVRECGHCGDTWVICLYCNQTWPCEDYRNNHSDKQIEKEQRWAAKHLVCPFHD